MTEAHLLERLVGQPLDAFSRLPPEQRAGAIHAAVPDLHLFLDGGAEPGRRDAPPRTRSLAASLATAVAGTPGEHPALAQRIVTDALLRHELAHDQNVYLGPLFTRRLTRAVPDVMFQPAHPAEVAAALAWARCERVPVTLRGAASTAMGGAVANDGGLALDFARLDHVELDASNGAVVVGAGARLRAVHARLAADGRALPVYPSNLGGTFAGWFATGGIGMNAFAGGCALDAVLSADVLLPNGMHAHFHRDGRLDVHADGRRLELSAADAQAWFRSRALEPLSLADFAGSEGTLGAILQLTLRTEPLPDITAFLVAFDSEAGALAATRWVVGEVRERRFAAPANLKMLSGEHLSHVRHVWADEAAQTWRRHPGALSAGEGMPWRRIVGPAEAGADVSRDPGQSAAYVFVDFFDREAARAFAAGLAARPEPHVVLGADSVRFAAERFRPQQSKRLGPGLVAAEVLMPFDEVGRFLPRAQRIAERAGRTLDSEVYVLDGGQALVIAALLTDHRRASYLVELLAAPVMVDLAMREHAGRPYVLGRWQAAWARATLGAAALERLQRARRALDPSGTVNPGVRLGLELRGVAGALLRATFAPGVRALRELFNFPVVVPALRALLDRFPGPAANRGAPAEVGAPFHASAPPDPPAARDVDVTRAPLATPAHALAAALPAAAHDAARAHADAGAGEGAPGANGHGAPQTAAARALNCVNCGECNSVCPIFVESKIRLPQMLTHLGERVTAGEVLGASAGVLLDLCMRCGNCEEVCQAGIPHLPLYEQLQRAADAERPRDVERHTTIVAAVRASQHYTREFLQVRPGGYQKRTPASLPGMARFLVLRAENDAGPAATCIHCGACVPVCPTHANHEFEGTDPRSITTDQARCIGCGTCVEVCPANLANGGQTLRVMEAPGAEWLAAMRAFDGERS